MYTCLFLTEVSSEKGGNSLHTGNIEIWEANSTSGSSILWSAVVRNNEGGNQNEKDYFMLLFSASDYG